jgi:predicted DNA binding CopG/RHH family protein
MKKGRTIKLDTEEQKILESVESDEWKRVENFQEEADFAKDAATYYLNKDARVNIRIPSAVLSSLKKKASYKP